MANFIECPKCGEYHFNNQHCKPVFYYNIPEFDEPETWRQVRANNFNCAAENACIHKYSEGDYNIVKNSGTDVIIIKDSNGAIKRFKIKARTVPEYEVIELK